MPLVKPPQICFQPGEPPSAGVKFLLPLHRLGVKTPRDLAGNVITSFTGTPVWSQGVYGAQLGTFSSSNYVVADPPQQIMHAGTYPCWMAALVSGITAPNADCPISQGSSSVAATLCHLRIGNAVATRVEYISVDDAATSASCTSTGVATVNDGQPHVVMGVSYASNDHRLYVDGVQIATSTTALGTATYDRLTLGVRRGTTVTGALTGFLVHAAAGNGKCPNPLALAMDWLSGRFTSIRPERRVPAYFADVTASVTFTVSAAIDSLDLSASLTTAAPASRTATLSAAIADIALAGSVTTAAPASRTAAFLAAVASLGLTGSVTTASPASRTATLSAAIASLGLTGSVTTATPGSILASLNAAIASLGLSGSLTTFAPGGVTATFSGSVASVGLTSTITVGAAVDLPANLIQAIAAQWAAEGLNEAIGKLYQNCVPAGSEGLPPNCIVKVTRGTACLLNNTSSIYNYSISFRVRDTDDVAAHENAVLVHAAFDQVGLEWATGFAAKLTQEDWPSGAEPKLSAGGKQIYWDEVRFLTRVKGTR